MTTEEGLSQARSGRLMQRATYTIASTFTGSEWPGVVEARSDSERRTYTLAAELPPLPYEPAGPQPPLGYFRHQANAQRARFDVVGREAAFAGDDWPPTIQLERLDEPAEAMTYALDPR